MRVLIVRPGQFSSGYGGSPCAGAGNSGPHDSGSVIGDVQTQNAAQPLLQGACGYGRRAQTTAGAGA